MKGITRCDWQPTTQLSFNGQQEFSEHHQTWFFHHMLCNNPEGALYIGALA